MFAFLNPLGFSSKLKMSLPITSGKSLFAAVLSKFFCGKETRSSEKSNVQKQVLWKRHSLHSDD